MLDIYTVTFIGHRYIDRFSFVEEKADELVRDLIGSKAYVDFLVGRDGDFDQIVSSTVLRVKKHVFDANQRFDLLFSYYHYIPQIILRISKATLLNKCTSSFLRSILCFCLFIVQTINFYIKPRQELIIVITANIAGDIN